MDRTNTRFQQTIADFFRKEQANLVGFVRRLIDDTAARDGEDIVQDVALNLFHKADLTVPIEALSAYVYRALRNKVIDILRKPKREEVSLSAEVTGDSRLTLADVLHDARYDTARELEKQEIRQCLFEAIESLSTSQKAIIIETEFEGRSFRELSEAWEIPLGTLLARKSRGLQAIRTALADLEIYKEKLL